jgi:hypothetical protein
MTRTIRILALLAAAGGAAWLAKFGVIVATDGGVDDEGAAAVFFVAGAALMAVGAATLTLRLARGTATIVAAAVAAPFLWGLSFMVLDPLAQGVVGDAGPGWLQDESAIALTGAVWLLIGLAARQSSSRATASTAAAAVTR